MELQLDYIRKVVGGRRAERIQPAGAKASAVLIPLVECGGAVSVLFERRSADVRQGGEVCFPGGRIERSETVLQARFERSGTTPQARPERGGTAPQARLEQSIADFRYESPGDAAVRETAEELLLSREQIEIVAPMHCMAGPGGAEVTSFLGILHNYRGTFSENEVAEVFCIPLDWFAAHPPEIHNARMCLEPEPDFPWHLIPGGRDYPMRSIPRRFYFYETEYGVIWGMTAELLYHFLGQILPETNEMGYTEK